MDSRGDLYTPQYNHGCTVLDEYMALAFGKANYDEIFRKYSIDHVLIYRDGTIDTYIKKNIRYQLLYGDDKIVLYKKQIG